MDSTCRVSIIINNHNYGRFLGEAIDSALGQTYPDTEVIVVDDGSTDNSQEVMAGYGDRITPVLKENGGQGSTFNAGFACSHGDILLYLDSDDWLTPTAAEEAVRLFDGADTVKIQWPLWVVDAHGKRTGEIIPQQTPPEGDMRELAVRDGPLYDWNVTPPTSGNAWSRSFLSQVFPMPEPPYRNGADVYLITLAPVFGRMRTVQEPQGCYRMHGSNNYCNRVLDDARIQNYIQRFESSCEVLQRQLEKQGADFDPELWKQRNFNYLWPSRLLRARRDIEVVIPPGSTYLFVNAGEWGDGEPVRDRHALPFLEREGQYWGPPADDRMAIQELERARAAGARFILFWWTAFWWLEQYPRFARYLSETYRCLLDAEHLMIFDLQPSEPEETRCCPSVSR